MLLHNGASFKSSSLEENIPQFLGGCGVIYLFSGKPVLTSASSQSSAYCIEQWWHLLSKDTNNPWTEFVREFVPAFFFWKSLPSNSRFCPSSFFYFLFSVNNNDKPQIMWMPKWHPRWHLELQQTGCVTGIGIQEGVFPFTFACVHADAGGLVWNVCWSPSSHPDTSLSKLRCWRNLLRGFQREPQR